MEAVGRIASAGDQERRKSLDQGLLHAVNLEDCEFSGDGDEFNRLKTRYAPTDGDVVVEDNKLRPGLRMHLHRDGLGATFTVDHRVNTWLTVAPALISGDLVVCRSYLIPS